MQVKKFEAPTLQEALDTVKRELGPEAIILQTKKYKRGFGLMSRGSIEVTAAISDRSLQKKAYVETRLPEPARERVKKLPSDRQVDIYDKMLETTRDNVELGAKARAITATRYVDIDPDEVVRESRDAQMARMEKAAAPAPKRVAGPAYPAGAVSGKIGSNIPGGELGAGMTVQEEVRHLKRMIDELKTAQDVNLLGSGAQALMSQSKLTSPALQDAFDQLVVSGMDRRYALNVIKQAGFELGDGARDPDSVAEQVATEIMSTTEVASPLAGVEPNRAASVSGGPVIIAVVGPTGVGKTTTVAKMASEAILKRNLRVGLINLDSYKIAAFDQLGTYAKILNVPFRSAASTDDLKAALADFQGLDLVIVDTTGRSQRDPGSLGEMQAMLHEIPGIRTHLVLSVTTRDSELYDMAARFSIFRPEGLIISKLDEGTIYGAIYNVCQKAKLPLLYFTTGQRVPEDIEEATRERVAALVLDL